MRRWSELFVVSCFLIAPAVASAADVSFTVDSPKFPNPFVTAILGLGMTAVVVVGARACVRSPNTMMYMVLATLALTAVMVAYSNRLYSEFRETGMARLAELERQLQSQGK